MKHVMRIKDPVLLALTETQFNALFINLPPDVLRELRVARPGNQWKRSIKHLVGLDEDEAREVLAFFRDVTGPSAKEIRRQLQEELPE